MNHAQIKNKHLKSNLIFATGTAITLFSILAAFITADFIVGIGTAVAATLGIAFGFSISNTQK